MTFLNEKNLSIHFFSISVSEFQDLGRPGSHAPEMRQDGCGSPKIPKILKIVNVFFSKMLSHVDSGHPPALCAASNALRGIKLPRSARPC